MKSLLVAIAVALFASASAQCEEQDRFNIVMCESHTCNECRMQWCVDHCQQFQKLYPNCRCEKWNEGRNSFSGGDHSNKGRYGDVGDYARPLDNIICPMLAAGINMGRMKLDAAKMMPASELANYLREIGSEPFAQSILDSNNVDTHPLDIFHMNNNPALEHGFSSGIRDPLPKNKAYLDELLSFANSNGEFTATELIAAGKHFQLSEHQAKLVGDRKVPQDFRHVDVVFAMVLLPALGRCGPNTRPVFGGAFGNMVGNHYPNEDCSGKELHMRSDDIENLFWENRLPDDFEFLAVDSAAN